MILKVIGYWFMEILGILLFAGAIHAKDRLEDKETARLSLALSVVTLVCAFLLLINI